jgi:cytochrome c
MTYLTAPRKVVEGTRMAFPGLPKPEDREDVIAYLKQVGEQ